MKAKLIQVLIAYLVIAIGASSSIVVAQQPSTRTSSINDPTTRVQQPLPQLAPDQSVGDSALQQLIEQALENNPEIKAMQRRFDMMRARIPQAKALDEPVLSVGYMGNIAPFYLQRGDPSSGRTISISQESALSRQAFIEEQGRQL